MFDNIGEKIKKFSVTIFYIMMALSVVSALILFVLFFTAPDTNKSTNTFYDENNMYLDDEASNNKSNDGIDPYSVYAIEGLVILIVGPISAYITSMFTYGFGELICNSDEAKKSLKRIEMAKCVNNYQNNIKIGLEPDKEAENADSNQSSNSDE